jgi:putative ABC transport system permease protein
MMDLLRISARNLLRNKFRTLFTILGAAVAVLAFVMLQTVLTAWSAAADYAAKDRIATRHKVSFVITVPKRYIDTVRATEGVAVATYANWFGAKDPNNPDSFFATLAVDPGTFLKVYDEMVVPPEQVAAWLEDRKGAVVGDVLARQLGVKVGDKVTLSGTIYPGDWEFNVRGIYSASRKSIDNSQFLFHWDYMNESLSDRGKDQIGWIISRIDDPTKGTQIGAAIDAVFDVKDVQTATMSERAMNLSFMAMFSAMLTALEIVSLIIMAIMMLILGNTIAMGVRERTGEYAVLRAVGFMPRQISFMIVGEGVVVGVLSAAAGCALAYPIVERGLGRWLEENMGSFFPWFRIEPKTLLIALVLAVGLALVASLAPAWQAAKLNVTDALRRVE